MREPPKAKFTHTIESTYCGRIAAIDNRQLGRLAKLAGAPHDKAAGVELHSPLHTIVETGQPLFTIHAESKGELAYALSLFLTYVFCPILNVSQSQKHSFRMTKLAFLFNRNVQPKVNQYKQHTPVLVDDIISTAHTMIQTVRHLKSAAMPAAVCIGVHAIFAGNAYKNLEKENVALIATCNTISHISNKIDLSAIILTELKQLRGY